MAKTIMIRVSEYEFSEIQSFVEKGLSRSKADFVRTAAMLQIEKNRDKTTSS